MDSDNIFKNGVFVRSTFFNIVITVITLLMSIKFPKEKFFFIYEYIIGTIVTYFNDIVFVQRYFTNDNGALTKIKYSDLWYRIGYSLNISRISKFLVAFTIQILLVHKIETIVSYQLKKNNLFQTPPKQFYNNGTNIEQYRTHLSLIIKFVIKLIIDILLINFIKFKWAYVDSPNDLFSLIISTLLVLILLITSLDLRC